MAFDWGSLAGAAASLGSAYLGSQSAKDSGKDASRTAQQANELQWRMYQDQRSLNQPFYNAGLAANNRYLQMLGLPSSGGASQNYYDVSSDGTPIARADLYASNPAYRQAWDAELARHKGQWNTGYWSGSDRNMINGAIASALGPMQQSQPQTSQEDAFASFRNTPGYQFGLDMGRKQIEASAAARGGLNSGATLKALQRYGTDYADQQGYTPYMNRLASLFGGAQTAASNIGNAGGNYASQAGNNLMNASQARQQSTYASNAAWQNGLQNAAGFFGDWYGNRYGGGG